MDPAADSIPADDAVTLSPDPVLRTITFDVFEWACITLGADADEILSGESQARLPPAPEGGAAVPFLGVVLENFDAYDWGEVPASLRQLIAGHVAGHFWIDVSKEVAAYQVYRQYAAARNPQVPPPDRDGKRSHLRQSLSKLDPSEYYEVTARWPLRDLLIYMEASRLRRFYEEIEDAVRAAVRQGVSRN